MAVRRPGTRLGSTNGNGDANNWRNENRKTSNGGNDDAK
jgi:hypothetical protein